MENLKLVILNYKKTIISILIVVILIIAVLIIVFKNKKEETKIIETFVEEKVEEEKEEIIEEFISVDIKGQIKKPGVYKIEKNLDSRVNDLIKYAGGLTTKADTSVINLSMKLKDQMVIIIYSKDEVKKYSKTKEKEQEKLCICDKEELKNDACIKEEQINNDNQEPSNTIDNQEQEIQSNTLININKASKEELMTISGIGESKAISIIKYREEIGLYQKIEDIMNVSGIGEALYQKIKDYITV